MSALGWQQFWCGGFPPLSLERLLASQENNALCPVQWTSKLLHISHRWAQDSWHNRNSIVHGVSPSASLKIKHEALMTQVLVFIESSPQCNHTERDWIYRDINLLRSYSYHALLAWYTMETATISRAAKRQQEQAINSRRIM